MLSSGPHYDKDVADGFNQDNLAADPQNANRAQSSSGDCLMFVCGQHARVFHIANDKLLSSLLCEQCCRLVRSCTNRAQSRDRSVHVVVQ